MTAVYGQKMEYYSTFLQTQCKQQQLCLLNGYSLEHKK